MLLSVEFIIRKGVGGGQGGHEFLASGCVG